MARGVWRAWPSVACRASRGLRGGFGQGEGGAGDLAATDGAELVIRAQPADEAARFLGGALGVQGHEVRQDFLVTQRPGPAVGVRHGAVEVVVELLEDGDEAGVVNQIFLGRERFVGPELFEDVVEAGQGQAVLGLGALAVRVQLLRELANALGLRGRTDGKGKAIVTSGLRVNWPVLQSRSCR